MDFTLDLDFCDDIAARLWPGFRPDPLAAGGLDALLDWPPATSFTPRDGVCEESRLPDAAIIASCRDVSGTQALDDELPSLARWALLLALPCLSNRQSCKHTTTAAHICKPQTVGPTMHRYLPRNSTLIPNCLV